MIRRRSSWLAWGLAAGAALLTLVPYLVALKVTPEGAVFSGFLINPVDGFSYLAKMQQGLRGSWRFELPYAVEPGKPALIFTFYLALGHLTRLLGSSPPVVFHGARLAAVVLMGGAAFAFLRAALPDPDVRWTGYALFLFGSGFGWLAGPAGWLTSDLVIPESIPFYAGLVNPHFPLAFAGVAAGAALVLGGDRSWRARGLAVGVGVGLALVLPFAAITLLAIVAGWGLWEAWLARDRLVPTLGGVLRSEAALAIALGLGAGPWLLYDYLLTRSHPVLAVWNAQNQTPSPSLPAYLAGFGLPLFLGLVGAIRERVWLDRRGRLLLAWLGVNFLLLYAPFNLQRRLSLGLFLPLAALAAVGVRSLMAGGSGRRWLPALALALSVPSNGFVMLAGISQVAQGDRTLLLRPAELAGYQWMAEHLKGNPTVLASPLTGNRLPAFADVRVLYGHPYETPGAEARRQQVLDAFDPSRSSESLGQRAAELGAELVVFGPNERAIGEPRGLAELPVIYQREGFQLLGVRSP